MYVQLGYFSHTVVAFTFSMDGLILRLVHNEFMKMTLLGPKLNFTINRLGVSCRRTWFNEKSKTNVFKIGLEIDQPARPLGYASFDSAMVEPNDE